MQRTVAQAAFKSYLRGDVKNVLGFAARAQDAAHLDTATKSFDGQALAYRGTKFNRGEDVYQLRFPLQDPATLSVPFGARTEKGMAKVRSLTGASHDELVSQRKPFTGTGFTASKGHIIPEFVITDEIPLADGMEFYRISDGTPERLAAYFNKRESKWIVLEEISK